MNFAVRVYEILSRSFALVSYIFSYTTTKFPILKKKKKKEIRKYSRQRKQRKGHKGSSPTQFPEETVPLGRGGGKRKRDLHARRKSTSEVSKKTETKTWIPFKRENNSGTSQNHPNPP